MKMSELTADRPRYQPGFEPENFEVEERLLTTKPKIGTLFMYIALAAVATISWVIVCCVIFP